MPTYEYKCEDCGFEFEKFQSIKAAAIKKCPQCGKSRVKRLIGMGGGVIFKGGGFYATDYRSQAYKTAAKADSGRTSVADPAKAAGDSKPVKPAAEAKGSSASTSDAKAAK